MVHVYSTYEAKAKFSEVIRKARAGQRIIITYRGEEIAEIAPLNRNSRHLAKSLARLEDQGILSSGQRPSGSLKPLAKRPGALARFLESRE